MMKEDRMPLREWLVAQAAGEFVGNDVLTQVRAGWWDWFCSDSRLSAKTTALSPLVHQISRSSKIDVDRMYVWFKNICPMFGGLYDDFRFADLETGETLYTVVPSCGHSTVFGRAEVWGRENGFDGPLAQGLWGDVLAFFGVDGSLDAAVVPEADEDIDDEDEEEDDEA